MIALSSKALRLDTTAAIELLRNADPLIAAENYPSVVAELYWRRKDLPAVIAISQAGIEHLLTAAKKANDVDAETLRSAAKQLAFNLASFTWPGWNEKGIEPTADQVATGFAAAKLNLKLARQLKRPGKIVANALWMLGAHKLAAAKFASAIKDFKAASDLAEAANATEMQLMLSAYEMMARLLEKPDRAAIRAKFNTIQPQLLAAGTDDARDYARQLPIAFEVLLRRNTVMSSDD